MIPKSLLVSKSILSFLWERDVQYCTVKDNVDVQTNVSYRYHFQQIHRENKYQIHRFVKHRFRLSIPFKTKSLSVTILVVFRAELPGPSLGMAH